MSSWACSRARRSAASMLNTLHGANTVQLQCYSTGLKRKYTTVQNNMCQLKQPKLTGIYNNEMLTKKRMQNHFDWQRKLLDASDIDSLHKYEWNFTSRRKLCTQSSVWGKVVADKFTTVMPCITARTQFHSQERQKHSRTSLMNLLRLRESRPPHIHRKLRIFPQLFNLVIFFFPRFLVRDWAKRMVFGSYDWH